MPIISFENEIEPPCEGELQCKVIKISDDVIGSDGFVFAEDGTGDFFILKSNGSVYIYKYFELNEEFYAESLTDYFRNATLNY